MSMLVRNLLFSALFLCGGVAPVAADDQPMQQKLLFVYDTLDDKSSFFITAFRDALQDLPYSVDEVMVAQKGPSGIAEYTAIVIYSRVMAFDMKSPVRKWISKLPSFQKKRVLLFVTANRWFYTKHAKKLQGMINNRDAQLVDAVTTATKNMTDEERKTRVVEFLSVLKVE